MQNRAAATGSGALGRISSNNTPTAAPRHVPVRRSTPACNESAILICMAMMVETTAQMA